MGEQEMNRDEWEFEYTAKRLATAAMVQRDYRASRVDAWEKKKEEVMKKIKDSGMTVHEDLASQMMTNAAKYTTNTLGGYGPQIVIDPTMQRELNECHAKITENRALQKSYDSWFQVLDANPEDRLKLTHDDWMFFFGK